MSQVSFLSKRARVYLAALAVVTMVSSGWATIARAQDNTAFGTNALINNTTGSDNSAFGFGALESNTAGQENTASGFSALGSNT